MVEKIKHGTPKFSVRAPIMFVSNGRPDRAQINPIPAITKIGAIIAAILTRIDTELSGVIVSGGNTPSGYRAVAYHITPTWTSVTETA